MDICHYSRAEAVAVLSAGLREMIKQDGDEQWRLHPTPQMQHAAEQLGLNDRPTMHPLGRSTSSVWRKVNEQTGDVFSDVATLLQMLAEMKEGEENG